MRLAVAVCLSVLSLSACQQADPGLARSDWGCAAVSGLDAVRNSPARYILVGEPVESREAPFAVAAMACRLAERGESVLIGVTDRAGGMTDAEAGLQRLADYLRAKHAAKVTFAIFEQPDERLAVRHRSESERMQAETVIAEVHRVGASRAIMLLPKSEAYTLQFRAADARFSGYAPMAMHLPQDEVLSFEVTRSDLDDAMDIALRMFPEPVEGFAGELALARLTRPGLPPIAHGKQAKLTEDGQWIIPVFDMDTDAADAPTARQNGETDLTRRVRILAEGGEDGLPDYEWRWTD